MTKPYDRTQNPFIPLRDNADKGEPLVEVTMSDEERIECVRQLRAEMVQEKSHSHTESITTAPISNGEGK